MFGFGELGLDDVSLGDVDDLDVVSDFEDLVVVLLVDENEDLVAVGETFLFVPAERRLWPSAAIVELEDRRIATQTRATIEGERAAESRADEVRVEDFTQAAGEIGEGRAIKISPFPLSPQNPPFPPKNN